MLDTQGLPAYPPAQDAWQFPPPPVPRRWKWVAIAATVLGVVAAIGLVVALVALESRDAQGLIDDRDLTAVIDRECELMTSSVESMTVSGSPRDQARTILDQNRAVQGMVDAVRRDAGRAVAADRPAERWLQDWEALVKARDDYVDVLRHGGPDDFVQPEDPDGDPLVLRMDDVFAEGGVCEVPDVLTFPFPRGNPSDV